MAPVCPRGMLNPMNGLAGFSVALVDDHPLFREGLVLALRQRAPALLIRGFGTLDELLVQLRQSGQETDLVLLDYRLPGDNGLVCAQRLRREFPQVACALLSGGDEPQLARRAREAGLMGYFPKALDVEALVLGLARLADGESCFHDPARAAQAGPTGLTPRQREILRMVAQGATNKEIAQVLQIAPHTVRNHLAQIFERTGAANRAQAAVIAHDLGHG